MARHSLLTFSPYDYIIDTNRCRSDRSVKLDVDDVHHSRDSLLQRYDSGNNMTSGEADSKILQVTELMDHDEEVC